MLLYVIVSIPTFKYHIVPLPPRLIRNTPQRNSRRINNGVSNPVATLGVGSRKSSFPHDVRYWCEACLPVWPNTAEHFLRREKSFSTSIGFLLRQRHTCHMTTMNFFPGTFYGQLGFWNIYSGLLPPGSEGNVASATSPENSCNVPVLLDLYSRSLLTYLLLKLLPLRESSHWTGAPPND